jgi:hypothetical protein
MLEGRPLWRLILTGVRLWHRVRDTIRDIAWRVGFDHGILISTVKYSRQAFRHGAVAASPLVKAIMAEGVAA